MDKPIRDPNLCSPSSESPQFVFYVPRGARFGPRTGLSTGGQANSSPLWRGARIAPPSGPTLHPEGAHPERSRKGQRKNAINFDGEQQKRNIEHRNKTAAACCAARPSIVLFQTLLEYLDGTPLSSSSNPSPMGGMAPTQPERPRELRVRARGMAATQKERLRKHGYGPGGWLLPRKRGFGNTDTDLGDGCYGEREA